MEKEVMKVEMVRGAPPMELIREVEVEGKVRFRMVLLQVEMLVGMKVGRTHSCEEGSSSIKL